MKTELFCFHIPCGIVEPSSSVFSLSASFVDSLRSTLYKTMIRDGFFFILLLFIFYEISGRDRNPRNGFCAGTTTTTDCPVSNSVSVFQPNKSRGFGLLQ